MEIVNPADNLASKSLVEIVDDWETNLVEPSLLLSLVRKQYHLRANFYARDTAGNQVISIEYKRDVASLVWFDATGDGEPPSVAMRTTTLKSIGQYLSRLGAVATDHERGLGALDSDADFRHAEKLATELTRCRKAARAEKAFLEVCERLTNDEVQALDLVRNIIQEHQGVADQFFRSLGQQTVTFYTPILTGTESSL